LAPFTPFIADEMYRNLVCCTGGSADDQSPSVHLSHWPDPKSAYADAQLVADMALAQRVVSLGRAARESANLKMRQPLAEAIVGLPGTRDAESLARLADAVVKEELNVKSLKTVAAGSDLVDVAIHALPKQLGQKHGRRFPAIKAALAELDPLAVADAVERGRPVTVTVDGEPVEVLPDELQVRKSPKPGLAVAEDAGYLVAVTTQLTDELRWEGWAREISRNIQELRKKSGFEISDRIHTTVQAGPALASVWARFGADIASDTLSVSFAPVAPQPEAFTASVLLDGEEVLIGVRKA
jgi:isoleucyl-tRNA synthetase